MKKIKIGQLTLFQVRKMCKERMEGYYHRCDRCPLNNLNVCTCFPDDMNDLGEEIYVDE